MNTTTEREPFYVLKARHERAKDRVTILLALANKRTASPEQVMRDLEIAVEEEKQALEALLLSDEAYAAIHGKPSA